MSGPIHDLSELAASGKLCRFFMESSFAEAPDRIPLFPKPGTYAHPRYGQVAITGEKLSNLAQNFKASVYQKHIPIDAEHQTKLSGALGYVTDVILNEDGSADAQVEWTNRGRSLVADDRFKYVSPEWYDRWEQPDTNVEFEDVLCGLALTTRPFFKDANGALRPLVAREGELIAPQATTEEVGADVTSPAGSDDSTKPKGQEMTEPNQMTEEVTKQFRELTDRVTAAESARTAAEEQAKTFAEQIESLKAANELKAFTDEVRGRSDANNIPYVGDVQYHVETLQALPAERRQSYMERERKIAAATRAKNAGLFAELGSDTHAEPKSAEDEITLRASELVKASPGKTHAVAFTEVLESDKALARRYASERRVNTTRED